MLLNVYEQAITEFVWPVRHTALLFVRAVLICESAERIATCHLTLLQCLSGVRDVATSGTIVLTVLPPTSQSRLLYVLG